MKNLNIKGAVLLFLAVALISAGFTAAIGCSGEAVTYKSAVALSVSGEGRVHRGDGSLPVYTGLSLRHGDTLQTETDSTVTVKMENGKYALIEPNTSVTFSLYESETESVAVITLTHGAVYIEADTEVSDGMTFGIAVAPASSGGASAPDAYVLGGMAAYRVESSYATTAATTVQAIFGSVILSLPETGRDGISLTAGNECRIERDTKGAIRFPVSETATDPYSLPDRYIALDSEGVFDADGALIQRPPSGDLSLKEITVIGADGSAVPLIPEFDNGVAGYVAETDAPLFLTVTANHRRTRLEIQCHTAASIKTEGNAGEVTFSADEPYHAVSILVVAEDGSEVRFSVNIAPSAQ